MPQIDVKWQAPDDDPSPTHYELWVLPAPITGVAVGDEIADPNDVTLAAGAVLAARVSGPPWRDAFSERTIDRHYFVRAVDRFGLAGTFIYAGMVTVPGLGSDELDAATAGAIGGNVPGDGTVTTAKLATNAVTGPKLASSAVTVSKIASSAVTAVKIADGAVGETKLSTDVQTKINRPLNNYASSVDPTANDDSADTSGNGVYSVGSEWINTTLNTAYKCLDATATAAVWVQLI
jgi:hypothetical protein